MTDLTLSAELRSRRYLLQSYQKRVLSTDQHARYVEKQYMHKLAVTVLCQLMPHLRLNETIVYVIGQNISQNPQWNMLIACENMKHLEKYAWNLIDFPWKKEFLTIKVSPFFPSSYSLNFVSTCTVDGQLFRIMHCCSSKLSYLIRNVQQPHDNVGHFPICSRWHHC